MSDASVSLLSQLVRCPSVTPSDAGCQDLLEQRLTSAGFRCERMPFGAVSNLWARVGSAAPLLCFAGHTDVVPPGPLEQWDSDPFEPVCRQGRLYGRGAADMKGGVAAMVVAAETFLAANPGFNGSLAFLLTSDEEGPAVDGTARVIETLGGRGERIDWCIVGEPSCRHELGDTIRIGRRGSLNGSLLIRGVQGHVAYPELVDNPIRRFAPVLAELHETRWDDGNAHFPPTSFQVTDIQSGVGRANVTPPELRASFNFRYSSEWSHRALQSRVAGILDGHGLDYRLDWQLSGEPFLTEPGLLTAATSAAIEEVCGIETRMSTGGGTSDGRFISPAGADVVELGLVNDSIHMANEYVRIEDVPRLAAIYRRIMERLLA